MYSLISDINNKVELSIIKYLFWVFVLTYGEPDVLVSIVQILQKWS